MVDRGMLKMSDVAIIWQSGKIPNGPWGSAVGVAGRPEDGIHRLHAGPAEVAQGYLRPVEQGSGVGYVPATMDLYKDIIDLREAERRGDRQPR